jgi:hypothetical protein
MTETEYFVITYIDYQQSKLKLDWKKLWDSCLGTYDVWKPQFNSYLLQYGLAYEKDFIERPMVEFKIIDKKKWLLARIKYGF